MAVVLTLVQTKQIYINETIQKHSTKNTKHSKYKYTYYQNTHTIVKTPHTLRNNFKQPQHKIHTNHMKQSQYIQLPSVTMLTLT